MKTLDIDTLMGGLTAGPFSVLAVLILGKRNADSKAVKFVAY
jgi:hypothetical protein